MTKTCRQGTLLLVAISLFGLLRAERPDFIQSNYSKHEFRIPMRDGTRLFTAVYEPKDAAHHYPIMLERTPYGISPYGKNEYPAVLGPSEELAQDGYIFAYQDVRGRMMSEGQFNNIPPENGPVDEATDAYDTIDWLVRNIPNNSGKVGMWGISYPGFYAACALIGAHPALAAVSPQAPIADWFVGDDFHHNGAFFLAHAFGFLYGFGRPRPKPTTRTDGFFEYPTPDGYQFYLNLGPLPEANRKYMKDAVPFWNELMRHGTYDDFWQARNLLPHLDKIRPAVLTVGGWFDAEDLFGTLSIYRAIEASGPGGRNLLVMGPWFHGQWFRSAGDVLGDVRFGSDTSDFFRKNIEFEFFRHFLKEAGDFDLPKAYVFLTGANEWRREAQWPPPSKPRSLYFRSGGRLDPISPAEDSGADFDAYTSDPAKPVPYIGQISSGMAREYMTADQRFASRRTDVLAYQTEVLKEDVTVAGQVSVHLEVSTSGTDSDFVVKLVDVYPDDTPDNEPNPRDVRMGGYQQLVRGEPFRGKFRKSFSDPEPLVPGQVTPIEYTMPDIFHTFRSGHRIMVQVQSSWFPLVDRNPQQFEDIYSAQPGDFQKAEERVYRSRSFASYVTLGELR